MKTKLEEGRKGREKGGKILMKGDEEREGEAKTACASFCSVSARESSDIYV